MIDTRFNALLTASRPEDYHSDKNFTDKVMKSVQSSEILSSAVRNMDVTKKETFTMKLKHLPKLGLVALALGVLVLLTGTTYAVVKTVEHFNNIQLNEETTNEFGRKELNVSFNGCQNSKNRATYELKKDGNLSAEDGVKTLQARCDMADIDTWFKDIEPIEFGTPYPMGRMDTITSINGQSISLKKGLTVEIKDSSKILSGNKEIAISDLSEGDTVFLYPDIKSSTEIANGKPIRLFLATQSPEYYDYDHQAYVNERGPCRDNETLSCLRPSNINHVSLILAYGDGVVGEGFKELQGRVVSYDETSIILDVGKGVKYTLQTTSNIIGIFNQSKVFELTGGNNIFSKTKPEDLTIRVGDSLEITYVGDSKDTESTIKRSDIISVQLMVERVPSNLDVVRKY